MLADETINRVAKKATMFDRRKGRQPTSYIFGFAARVLLEYRRTARNRETGLPTDDLPAAETREDANIEILERRLDCLATCLERLSRRERDLLLEYYALDGKAKIAARNRIARRLGCGRSSLHSRIFRIRAKVKVCISGCLKKK